MILLMGIIIFIRTLYNGTLKHIGKIHIKKMEKKHYIIHSCEFK